MAAFTENCDFFASFDEEGFNRIAKHIMLQRPSLFHRGTPHFVANIEDMCQRFQVHPEVPRRNNPLIGDLDLLPVPGGEPYGMEYCIQFAEMELDLHTGDRFTLPPQIDPLQPQQFALRAKVCVGIGCPDQRALPIPPPAENPRQKDEDRLLRPLPIGDIHCFCLEFFAVLKLERRSYSGKEYFNPVLGGLEIVDIAPEGLENSLECIMGTTLRMALLPGLRIAVETIVFEIADKFKLILTPLSAEIPHNPSIADNKISVFFNLQEI